jgi:hypothetical protein
VISPAPEWYPAFTASFGTAFHYPGPGFYSGCVAIPLPYWLLVPGNVLVAYGRSVLKQYCWQQFQLLALLSPPIENRSFRIPF